MPSVAARPAPPAKRSGHVALLLMGTLAVGGGAYALMPGENARGRRNAPSLTQGNAECPPRGSSSSSSHGGSGGFVAQQFLQRQFILEPFGIGNVIGFRLGGVARGGFGSSAHAFASHFSGGG